MYLYYTGACYHGNPFTLGRRNVPGSDTAQAGLVEIDLRTRPGIGRSDGTRCYRTYAKLVPRMHKHPFHRLVEIFVSVLLAVPSNQRTISTRTEYTGTGVLYVVCFCCVLISRKQC